MKIGRLYLTLFLTLSSVVVAVGQNFQEKIAEYLLVNGTHAQYNKAYDQMFEMLEGQFKSQDVTSDLWQELKKDKDTEVNNVVALIVSAYQKNFTEADITEMLAFYKSEAGRKLAGNVNELSESERNEVTNFFAAEVGKKIIDVQNVLAADITQISQYWSRDLFIATTNALSAKGYYLPN